MAVLYKMEFAVNEEYADLLTGVLALHVGHGWEEQALATGETVCVVYSGHAGFCAELQATVALAIPEARCTVQETQEENWAEAWKEFFTPVEGGSHFLVLAPWMQQEKEATSRIPLIIEPKMAFGTGHHATTSLCLDALSSLYTNGKVVSGMRFLDLGTGSGILGLAAAKLGLSGDGYDIDIAAVENAIENRDLNAVADQVFHIERGGAELIAKQYDIVLANILAGPLKDMASSIAGALPTDAEGNRIGSLILSGMLDMQCESVEAVYRTLGFGPAQKLQRGEWVALVFN